jgi:hypothetical protein
MGEELDGVRSSLRSKHFSLSVRESARSALPDRPSGDERSQYTHHAALQTYGRRASQ